MWVTGGLHTSCCCMRNPVWGCPTERVSLIKNYLPLQILTPFQVARFIVQSYPFGPDLMGLLTALAERQPGGAEASALPPSDQPSSSSGPALPSDWHIARTVPISVLRQRL